MEYDEEMRSCLESILNVRLSGDAWYQSTLPVRNGGLGIRPALEVAIPGFIASAHGSLETSELLLPDRVKDEPYKQLIEAEELWKLRVSNEAEQPENKSLQAGWDTPIVTHRYDQLLEKQTVPAETARIKAVASEQASAWLNAFPLPSLGLKLDDQSFQICCALRLGSQICQPYTCSCGNLVDLSGRHGLSCRYAKGRASRHAQSNDIIKRALASADMPSVLEPLGLSNSNNERPDGMSLFPWKQGKTLVWDVTCSDTLAWSHTQSNSVEAGKSAEQAEKNKLTKYEYLTQSYHFIPVATDTMGSQVKDIT